MFMQEGSVQFMKTIDEALTWLNGLLTFGIKPGIERMEWMLERLNHPERRLKAIHVAGTNGKGSTVEYLTKMIMEAGQEVGTFTSPHVTNIADRIAVNGQPISDEDFIGLANEIRTLTEELATTDLGEATEFEVMTIIAIHYFASIAYPDIVIIEAGLGGRLDSTNVIYPMLSIITNVSYDHTDILGDTIKSIASEKAGIIKSGVPVVTGATGEALHVIEEAAKANHSKIYRLGSEFKSKNEIILRDGEQFDFQSPFFTKEHLQIKMRGTHQVQNASLALMALDFLYFFFGLTVEDDAVKAGLKKAEIRARFEQVNEQPTLILDGAHNVAAIHSLVDMIKQRFPNETVHIIFSALKNKDIEMMVSQLEQVADQITFTSFSHPRAVRAQQLRAYSKHKNIVQNDNLGKVLEQAKAPTDPSVVTIITGSLYFVSECRAQLKL